MDKVAALEASEASTSVASTGAVAAAAAAAAASSSSTTAFEGWRDYAAVKENKLREQLLREARTTNSQSQRPQIFAGCTVYINGWTGEWTDAQLKRAIVEHGGSVTNYYSKTGVTHVVAVNLPDGKISNLSKHEKIVRPEWVVDSIQNGKLMHWKPYQTFGGAPHWQLTLTQTLAGKKGTDIVDDAASRDAASPQEKVPDGDWQQQQHQQQQQYTPQHIEESHRSAAEGDQQPTVSPQKPVNSPQKPVTSPQKATASKEMDEWTRKNTSGAPDFISKFYSSSRLHYLSTWKAELRKVADELLQAAADQHQLNEADVLEHGVDAGVQEPAEKRAESSSAAQKNVKSIAMLGRTKSDSDAVIFYVDMDCFFVSVALRDRPELRGYPVGVSHSVSTTSSTSSSDVASCNYEARKYGIYNGISIGKARTLCPNLVVLPYEFEKYRETSQRLYEVLVKYSTQIQAVSCDEAILDVSSHFSAPESDRNGLTKLSLAAKIRSDINKSTGCVASVGISSNILLAKMATKKAKPDGVFELRQREAQAFLDEQNVDDLPGVGWAFSERLNNIGVKTVKQLRELPLGTIQKLFGSNQGKTIHDAARGIDERVVQNCTTRKSVGVNISWGVRFTDEAGVTNFIENLAEEVAKKLKKIGMRGKSLSIRVYRRQPGAKEPYKHLGHGACDIFNKSLMLAESSDDGKILSQNCLHLYRAWRIPPDELRGVGVFVTKLEDAAGRRKEVQSEIRFAVPASINEHVIGSNAKQKLQAVGKDKPSNGNDGQQEGNLLDKPSVGLESIGPAAPANAAVAVNAGPATEEPIRSAANPGWQGNQAIHSIEQPRGAMSYQNELPTWSQIDKEVLDELPENIRSELMGAYQKENKDRKAETNEGSSTNVTARQQAAMQTAIIALPSPSQVDPSVLAALPASMRQELEEAMRQSAKRKHEPENLGAIEVASFKDKNSSSSWANRLEKNSDDHATKKAKSDENYAWGGDLDEDVLAALPEDIRREVIREYEGKQKRGVGDNKGASRSKGATSAKPFEEITAARSRARPARGVHCFPSLAGRQSVSEIRAIFQSWIRDHPTPLEEDVAMVRSYFRDLVCSPSGDLETARTLLMFLIRCTRADALQADWTRMAQELREYVQQSVIAVYKYPLILDSKG